eukprot:CAMPEP_0172866624 /NCGR_PEP_ID=MMETSP1075-20121228/82091_1 /TAXON_ID=2916 /ORGANISM="Ceratium fusus, Strain PA161109" /LENGTH=177 /DNA_ID=CAMNT_0013715809 /DNA_START=181 /DNA_END=711 /DNA_ORIENTATION=+
MPEEFNVEKDFNEKEKWRKAQPHIRCDLCRLLVDHTFQAVGDSTNEDDIYDHIDSICDKEALYNKHQLILDVEKGWQIVPVDVTSEKDKSLGTERSEHTMRWQTHAMKELCDNVIKPNDDEIKDSFLKAAKQRQKGLDAGRDATVAARATGFGCAVQKISSVVRRQVSFDCEDPEWL